MSPIESRDTVPQSAIDAAQRGFEQAYWEDGDELLAALRAAAPVIRRDEVDAMLAALRSQIEPVPPGPAQEGVRTGLRHALMLLETRMRDLADA